MTVIQTVFFTYLPQSGRVQCICGTSRTTAKLFYH